ncbi:MAG: ATP-binding protein [Patescibacteria group bacterium]
MNGFAVTGLVFVAMPSIIVGFFILVKGLRTLNNTTLIWSAFLFSVALWGFGMYKIGTAIDPINSMYWWRVAELGVILIPVLLVHFVISFLGLKRKLLLFIFYIVTAGFLYCDVFTNYFVDKLYFAFNQFYYILGTPLYTIFILIFVLSVIYILFELRRAYKRTTGLTHYQIKYLMWIFAVGFSGGVTSYLPVYNINIYPAWNATIIISMLMITYIIFKHHFMDIKVIATQVFAVIISSITLTDVFSAKSTLDLIARISIFLITVIFAFLLIQLVLRDVNRREKMEVLTKDLKKVTINLKKANDKLKRLDQAKLEFLSIASHQLRTPLTVIKGYVSMMLEGNFGEIPKLVKENLNKIYLANERLISLVESLLNISRIESGRLEFDIKPTDLVTITQSLMGDFKIKAKKKGLQLNFLVEKNIPNVLVDAQKIKEVIIYLIDNAIKYTDRGHIDVSLYPESQSVIFTCQDTGQGISVQDLSNLFNKFIQKNDTASALSESTGLSLYFSKMVVENMDGKIWAESAGVNQGSKFLFSVPRAGKNPIKKSESKN